MSLHIVFVEPEIPANTGNIARTCAATGAHLHLVRPLGFDTDDRTLKRAGLDYWYAVQVHYYDSFEQLKLTYPDERFFCASTHVRSAIRITNFKTVISLFSGKKRKDFRSRY